MVASTVSNMVGIISSMEGKHNAMVKVGEKEIYADLGFWRVVPKKTEETKWIKEN